MTDDDGARTSWEGDVLRDTIAYRFVEICRTLIDLVFEEDDMRQGYDRWLEQVADPEATEPMVVGEWQSEAGTSLALAARPVPWEFVLMIEDEQFEVVVGLLYDEATADVEVGGIARFEGVPQAAMAWGQSFLAMLEEGLFQPEPAGDDETVGNA